MFFHSFFAYSTIRHHSSSKKRRRAEGAREENFFDFFFHMLVVRGCVVHVREDPSPCLPATVVCALLYFEVLLYALLLYTQYNCRTRCIEIS